MAPEVSSLTPQVDRYLLASKKNESIVYRIGEVFEEIKSPDFDRTCATIASGCLLNGTVWAQIVSREIRLYDGGI